jgi:hypothetical protein
MYIVVSEHAEQLFISLNSEEYYRLGCDVVYSGRIYLRLGEMYYLHLQGRRVNGGRN